MNVWIAVLSTGHKVSLCSSSRRLFPVHALIAKCSSPYLRQSAGLGNARHGRCNRQCGYVPCLLTQKRLVVQNELGALPDFVPTPIRLATPTETKVLTNHRNWVLTVQLLPRIPYALQAAGGGPSTRLRPSLRRCTAHLCDCRPIESVSRCSEWSDGLFPSGPCAMYYYKPVCADAPRVQCSLDSLR